jgi:threonine/homoserine/homoserine lactone efflux protein
MNDVKRQNIYTEMFMIVKYAGVAYLICLGLRTLLSQDSLSINASSEIECLKILWFRRIIIALHTDRIKMAG